MFFSGSRYEKMPTYTVKLANGATVTAVRLPAPNRAPVIGAYPHDDSQRLDLVASHFLGDATTFWRLCDANGTVCPEALAARALVVIPIKGG
jgi:hypothetical protein